MSTNSIEIRATPDDVFRVLLDPRAYGFWVVGPDRVVEVSDDWPSIGASFTHETSIGPLRVHDTTEIEEIDRPRRLVLRANLRPLGAIASITFDLSHSDGTTTVTIDEHPIGGIWRPVWNPVFDRLLWARNVQALQRLRVIVESLAGDGAQALEIEAERPGATTALSLGTTLMFWALSAARGKRIFHPVGETYEGHFTANGSAGGLADTLDGLQTSRVIVRLSKGAGTPGPLPDVYGLAIKFPDAWGEGADQDFLLVTSGEGPAVRHALLPTLAPLSMRFTSVLPYDVRGKTVMIGARATQRRDASRDDLTGAAFSLDVATPTSEWNPVGTLTIEKRFGADVSFDPWNSSSDIVPSGMLNALRRSAYAGSRGAR